MKILAEPIDVIAKFKKGQEPMPYKFLYMDQYGISHEVKVDKINEVEKTKLVGVRAIVYRCQSVINGINTNYELKYIIQEYKWELYKM